MGTFARDLSLRGVAGAFPDLRDRSGANPSDADIALRFVRLRDDG
jgi:hypothetical protein